MLSRIKEIHARYHGEAQADLIMDGKGYKLWTRVYKGNVPALQCGIENMLGLFVAINRRKLKT